MGNNETEIYIQHTSRKQPLLSRVSFRNATIAIHKKPVLECSWIKNKYR